MLQLAEQGHELDLDVGNADRVVGPQKGAHLVLVAPRPFFVRSLERDAVAAETVSLFATETS